MTDQQPETLELRDYVRIVRRRRVWIVAGLFLGLAISVIRAQGQTTYKATALILLQARGIDAAGVSNGRAVNRTNSGGTGYVGDLYQSTIVMQSKVMRDRVEARLGYPVSVASSFIPFTDLVTITAETAVPKRSAEIANTFASEYRDFRREQTEQVYSEAINSLNAGVRSLRRQADALETEIERLPEASAQRSSLALLRATYLDSIQSFESRVSSLEVNSGLFAGSVQLVEPAYPPVSSSAPTRRQQAKDGVLIGLVIAGLFVAVAEFFDRRLTDVSSLERNGQPVLASVPRVLRWRFSRRPHVAGSHGSELAATEAYRGLRSALIGVTSALGERAQILLFNAERPRSGTSTTVLNLAHLFASSGRSTLLLSLDVHDRDASAVRGLAEPKLGFAEHVRGISLGNGVLTRLPDGLNVMTPGRFEKEPSEFLAEPRVGEAIAALRGSFDVVLIDSPALESWTDALSFSSVADAVILVTRIGKTTAEAHDRAIEAHQRAGGNVSGIVVTGVRVPSAQRGRVVFSRRRTTIARAR